MPTYSEGQFIVHRDDDSKYGEVLKVLGQGVYRVRYPVFNDEDRDYNIIIEKHEDLRPITFGESEAALYGSYLKRQEKWQVPCDGGTRVHNGDQKYHIRE